MPDSPAETAEFDQGLAEANDILDQLIAHYQRMGATYTDEENLDLLGSAITDDLLPDAKTTLLAVAVRRLARQGQ